MKASSFLWEKRSKSPFPVFSKFCTPSESKMRDKGLLLVPKKPNQTNPNQLQSCLSVTSYEVSTHRISRLGAHGNAKKQKRDNSTFYFSGVLNSKELNVLLHHPLQKHLNHSVWLCLPGINTEDLKENLTICFWFPHFKETQMYSVYGLDWSQHFQMCNIKANLWWFKWMKYIIPLKLFSAGRKWGLFWLPVKILDSGALQFAL